MFEAMVGSRREKRPRWKTVAAVLSMTAHLGLAISLVVYSFWKIDRLEGKYTPVTFSEVTLPPTPAVDSPPGPIGNGPGGGRAQGKGPAKKPKPPITDDDAGDENELPGDVGPGGGGEPGGGPGGKPGGVPNGIGDGEPVVQEQKPTVVAAVMIEGARISGDARIPLPDSTRQVVTAQGLERINATVKLCLSAAGVPTSIDVVKSTGFGEADAKISKAMSTWRYRPYVVNGKPVPVCTVLVFNYVLQ